MISHNQSFLILFRQELKEVIYSKLLWLTLSIYLLCFAIFVMVGTQESSIMGFSGMNRVLFSWSHVLVFILPLLALTASSTVITQYRENGTLEFFLSQPVTRKSFFLAMTLSRMLALWLPLFVIILISSIVGVFMDNSSSTLSSLLYNLKFILVSTSLIWCFLSIGFYVSEKNKSQIKAVIMMLLTWIFTITLLDFILIGLILKSNLNHAAFFFITNLNPIQASRLALLIELDSSLSTLGPIGFFIVNKIGSSFVFLIGTIWPLIVGMAFWFQTKEKFYKKDLI